MKARITLFSVLLLGAIWATAQSPSSSTPQGSSSGATSSEQTTPNASSPGAAPTDQGANPSSQTGTTPGQQGGTTPGQSDNGMAAGASQTGTAGSQNTLRGCLGGSPSNGTYYVTDSKSGTTYTLNGSADQLRTHVGQQVEVTGQALGSGGTSGGMNSSGASSMGSSDASASSTSGSASSQTGNAGSMGNGPGAATTPTKATNSFQVSGVTKIADHCGSSNTSN